MTPERRSAERFTTYTLVLITVSGLALFLIPAVWKYFSPFILGLAMAASLQPVIRTLENRFRFSHFWAVMIPVVLLCLLCLTLLAWFASFGINQINYLLSHSPELLSQASDLIRRALSTLGSFTHDHLNLTEGWTDNFLNYITSQLTALAGELVTKTVNWAAGLPSLLLYINFLIFGLYFISKDYNRLVSYWRNGFMGNPNTSTGQITSSAITGLMGWLHMQFVYAVLSLVVGSVYWSVFQYQYAILISIAAAILEFLPIVGNGTIYLPWAAIAFLSGRTRSGILALALFLFLLLIRRVTEPKLFSRSTGVTPLVGLIGMFAGLQAGGLMGLIGGPVVATVLVTLWEGDSRRTMVRDARALMRTIHRRWSSVPEEEEEVTADTPPNTAQEDSTGSAEKPEGRQENTKPPKGRFSRGRRH